VYELSLIKSMLNRDNYVAYRNYLRKEDFSKELYLIIEGVDTWFQTHVEPPQLEDVENLTFAKGIPEKQQEYVKGVFSSLQTVGGQESVRSLLESFRQKRLCEDIATAAYEASRGVKTTVDILALAEQLRNPKQDLDYAFVTDDLDDILDQTVRTPGLRWRLGTLNRSLGSLRKGNFGFVFARPETGKTTFLASEVTHMASQLKEEDGPIIWFNNEQEGKVVKLRCFQAALGARTEHLLRAPDRAKVGYQDATHGKLLLVDEASIQYKFVEQMAAKYKPSLMVFDQIDKIKGFDRDREDLAMGAIYTWARELAKTYCPVIGVCQADGTAEGERWLHMGHVSNAKTAKQAEADFILGIGKTHDSGQEFIRYLNISKNKLVGDADSEPGLRHARLDVIIHPDIARYEDIK
jgi:KaiC/GvpD/RAD55 family RecA-like ATPase